MTWTLLARNSIDGYISEQSRIRSTNVDMSCDRGIYLPQNTLSPPVLAWREEVSDEEMLTPKEISALDRDTESSTCCLVNHAKYACLGS